MSSPAVVPQKTFTLGSFTLDTAGNVTQGGSWKTLSDNKIGVTSSAGATQTFPVAWQFNADRQLVLSSAGAELFNFNLDKNVSPRFETRNAVLKVTPDILKGFSFELRGEWNLNAKHDMTFTTPDGVVSTITGVVNSPDSKFVFLFSAKNRPLIMHKLGFAGVWGNAPAGGGQLMFTYNKESGTGVFTLPGSVTIKKTTNQLTYEYKKGGPQSIDFQGTLIVNEDFTVSYQFSRRLTQTGDVITRESSISIGAQFQKNNFTGDLELTLKKSDGSLGTTTLAISGNFVGTVGKVNVAVGFRFTQVRDGQSVTTTFAFGGKVQFTNGTIEFAFASNSATRTISLTVGADIKLGKANIDARFNVDMGGGAVQGVTFLLGVKF
ncbi:MAG: hypothetical protein ACKV2U_04645 [Bryobacteraceae bacterium]